MDEVWAKLIEEFLSKMRSVPCDVEEFQAGLQQACEEVQTELEASKQSVL